MIISSAKGGTQKSGT